MQENLIHSFVPLVSYIFFLRNNLFHIPGFQNHRNNNLLLGLFFSFSFFLSFFFFYHLLYARSSWVAQTVKRLSTMWETWVRSLGREDPLEKEMAIHSSTIAWKIPWTEEPGRLQSMGSQRVGHN